MSPVDADQSQNTYDNKSDGMFENNMEATNAESSETLSNTRPEFFDLEQTTARRWVPI